MDTDDPLEFEIEDKVASSPVLTKKRMMVIDDHLDYQKAVFTLNDLIEDRNKEIERLSQSELVVAVIEEVNDDQGASLDRVIASDEKPLLNCGNAFDVKPLMFAPPAPVANGQDPPSGSKGVFQQADQKSMPFQTSDGSIPLTSSPPGITPSPASNIPGIMTPPIQSTSRGPRAPVEVNIKRPPSPPPGKSLWRGTFIPTVAMPYLERVCHHYGDVFTGLIISSPQYVALTAESLAKCISILDRCTPRTITCQDIRFLNVTLKDFDALGVQIDWLASRVASIEALRDLAVAKATVQRYEKAEAEVEIRLEKIRAQLGIIRGRVEEEELAQGRKGTIDFDQPLSFDFVKKVIISLDDLVHGKFEDEKKGKERRSKQAKGKKIYDSDDDDDDTCQSPSEANLSKTVDGCQQQIEEIGGEDEYSSWGLRIFSNRKTSSPLVYTDLGSCKLLHVFMKNELNSLVDVTVEKGESFLRGLLVNGWLLKMVVMSGHLEKQIATWTFNAMIYSLEEELRTSACDFWCAIISSEKEIGIDWSPSYSELRRALDVYGSVLDSSTFLTNPDLVQTGSSNLSLDSDYGWLPQNIRAWIKFIAACCQVRSKHSIFSTSEAEELLEALICFFLDRRLQGFSMLMNECMQSAISFFTDEEWQRSCEKVAKSTACRVPKDLNCLRIVDCISGINARSKLLKSALSYEILILCLDNKVIDGKEILKHLSSIKLKDKSCDLFRMYICLALTENWLLAAPLLEAKPEIYKDWNTFLRNCSCQINIRDMRSEVKLHIFYKALVRDDCHEGW